MAKQIIVTCLVGMMSFVSGWYFHGWLHICPVSDTEIKTEIKYKNDTKTEVVYVPKYIYPDGSIEKTDVDVNIGKQKLAVKSTAKILQSKSPMMKSMFLIKTSCSSHKPATLI